VIGISFVIPCWNEEAHVSDCIRSIIDNVPLDVVCEVIVVDNNCTDRTVEIARSLGAQIVAEPTKGVVHARQRGFRESRYDLIANIDADTQITADWVRAALAAIEPDHVAAVTGPLIYHDASKTLQVLTRWYYHAARLSIGIVGSFLQGGNCMIKKKYLEIADGYDTSIPFYGEDTMTAKRLGKHGDIIFSMDIIALSSARRLQRQGVIDTTWKYLINYLSVNLLGRSWTREYEDHR
jgi:glycosyltransferase involved in cell wall biosynthesis